MAVPIQPLVFRAAPPVQRIDDPLGQLARLAGVWVGSGFNLISLPFFDNEQPNGQNDPKDFRLKLNATREILEFTRIGGAVPNRGSTGQLDIDIFGLTYLQRVSDAFSNDALHIEPGLWLLVPNTDDPPGIESVVRQGSVPHGDSFLATGTALTVQTGPTIGPSDPTPFSNPNGTPTPPNPPAAPLGRPYLDPFFNEQMPPGLVTKHTIQEIINDPNILLQEAIAGRKITETIVLQISTVPDGEVFNISFVTKNAKVNRLDAIFWIETVEQDNGPPFVQLQYTQKVILNFLGIDWPHISVATLVKQ